MSGGLTAPGEDRVKESERQSPMAPPKNGTDYHGENASLTRLRHPFVENLLPSVHGLLIVRFE